MDQWIPALVAFVVTATLGLIINQRQIGKHKCETGDHKFDGPGYPIPYVYCKRMGCRKSAVASWAPESSAPWMHNAIPIEDRYPPVTLNPDGSIADGDL